MLNITVCTVYFFEDATASVKLNNKSLFNKQKFYVTTRSQHAYIKKIEKKIF